MRQVISAGLVMGATALAFNSVQAADLAAPMPTKAPVYYKAPPLAYNWTGFYVGGFGGYGWGSWNTTDVTGTGAFPAGTTRNIGPDGWLGGVQAGLNYQFPSSWVIGIEGDFAWSHISGTNVQSGTGAFATTRLSTISRDMNSITTATGRVGHAFNNWLFYAKGGGAWAHTNSNSGTVDPATGQSVDTDSGSNVRSGWTIGGGVEWGFWQNWSAVAEYDYMDFGTVTEMSTPTYYAPFTGGSETRNVKLDISVIKVGLNYRFNFGGPLTTGN